MHPFASKRPRSPDSPVGRTPKRPFIIARTSSVYKHSFVCRQDGCPGISDDWVQQASGLSINSPAIQGSQSTQQQPGKVQAMTDQEMDEKMTTEERDAPESYFPPVSLPLLLIPNKMPLPPGPHEPSSSPAEGQERAVVSSIRPQSTLPPQRLLAPTIVIHPSTPAESPVRDPSLQNATDQYPPSTPMQTSALSPWSPGTSRKLRVTMGPRLDCAKCQQGVKGHWMHLY